MAKTYEAIVRQRSLTFTIASLGEGFTSSPG
jgi:hypothetical protein